MEVGILQQGSVTGSATKLIWHQHQALDFAFHSSPDQDPYPLHPPSSPTIEIWDTFSTGYQKTLPWQAPVKNY